MIWYKISYTYTLFFILYCEIFSAYWPACLTGGPQKKGLPKATSRWRTFSTQCGPDSVPNIIYGTSAFQPRSSYYRCLETNPGSPPIRLQFGEKPSPTSPTFLIIMHSSSTRALTPVDPWHKIIVVVLVWLECCHQCASSTTDTFHLN